MIILDFLCVVVWALVIVLLVWDVCARLRRRNRPAARCTYEFMLYDLKAANYQRVAFMNDEERKVLREEIAKSWDGLAELGKQGWEIVGVNQDHHSGIEYILQRETIHGL